MTNFIYKAGNPELAPVLLLHSTGGDENQLVPVAEMIAPDHPILSIRGRINDNGINRYFKLRGSGGFTQANFDLESLEEESRWLAKEIQTLAQTHQINLEKLIAVGYSNGANVALSMLLKGIFTFEKVIAFHGMQLSATKPTDKAVSTKLFLSHAENDPIVPAHNFNALVNELENAACPIEIYKTSYGHQLTEEELLAAKKWLEKN